MESLFDTPLTELVRGIRAHREDEETYIAACIQRLQIECKSADVDVKANSVLKWTYLEQLTGCDSGWIAFAVVETVARPVYWQKRVGYLAASLAFGAHTEVLLLVTNSLKKDLHSVTAVEPSSALTGLANFVTPSLAQDLWSDVVTLSNSSRPYLRKKAILVLYRCLLHHRQMEAAAVARLEAALRDPDPAVVSAAVAVLLELAQTHPQLCLPLVPTLFPLLTSGANNWVLIKLLQLMEALCAAEKRLRKKLAAPVFNLLRATQAKSLAYECCRWLVRYSMESEEAMRLCAERLAEFAHDRDRNLKYLALGTLCTLARRRPDAVERHRNLYVQCLHDADKNIRLRALALLTALVRDAESMRRTGELLLGQLRQQQTAIWNGGAHDLHAFHNAVVRALLNSVQESTRGEWRLRTRGDFEWFLRQVLRPLAVELPSVEAENARQAAELLRNLAIRADEMRGELLQWSRAVLQCRYGREEADRKRQLLRIAVWMLGEYGDVEAVADGELLGECCVVDAAAVSQNGIVSAGAVAQSELLMALTKMQARRPDGLPPAPAQALAQLVPHGVEERDRLRWLRRWMREGKQHGAMATISFADGVHQVGVTVPRSAPVWPAEWHSACWLDEAEAQEMQEQVQEVGEKVTAGVIPSSPSSQPQPLLPFTPPRNAAPEGEHYGRSAFYLTDRSTSALGGTAAPTSTVERLLFFDEEESAGAEATPASDPSNAAVAAPAPDHPVHLRERATTASATAAREAYEEIGDLLGDAELAPTFAAHPVPSGKPRRARRPKPRRRGGSQHTQRSATADKDEQALVAL